VIFIQHDYIENNKRLPASMQKLSRLTSFRVRERR
jgi:hypothetical protein